jgi:hypothetical protein
MLCAFWQSSQPSLAKTWKVSWVSLWQASQVIASAREINITCERASSRQNQPARLYYPLNLRKLHAGIAVAPSPAPCLDISDSQQESRTEPGLTTLPSGI